MLQDERARLRQMNRKNKRKRHRSIVDAEPLESRRLLSGIVTLASFNGTDGAAPGYGVILSGNTLYGVSPTGGDNGDGDVFSVPTAGGTPTVLASFNGPDGNTPQGVLTLSDGTIYGLTKSGGAYGDGEVYSLPDTGGTPTVLASFNGTDGSQPLGLMLSGETLYGNAFAGGGDSFGDIFSLPITGGTPTVLTSFNSTSGEHPHSELILSDGIFYASTNKAGPDGGGTIISLPIAGGTPTVLASFSDSSGGSNPNSLFLSGSTLYGATESGGPGGLGEDFSVPITGGTPTVLFNGVGASILRSGVVEGTTIFGNAIGGADGDGELLSMPTTGGTPTVLASFNGTNGSDPISYIHDDADGDIYSTTNAGGDFGDGTVYELPSAEAPIVSSFAVNGGAAQRSMVTSATVVFNQPVNLATGAMSLVQRATGGGSPTTITAVLSSSDNMTWNLTFPTYTGGSLPDGIYDLIVTAADVTAVSPPNLPMSGGDQTFTFDRLFGDSDGNGIVNNADYFQFKQTYGQATGSASYNPIFDYDANGIVNNADYFQFKARYGQQIVISAQTSTSSDAALLGNANSSSNDKIIAQILKS
jgi:uncharacterized repeat protein (TIGR03803 family)